MSTVLCMWSGGKDSSYATYLHLLERDNVVVLHYTPYFTDDIPLITKVHHEFILCTEDLFSSMGATVINVRGESYVDHCLTPRSRGENKGLIRGFPVPIPQKCSFAHVKVEALSSVDVGYYDYKDIGICIDETDRLSQLTPLKRSILAERNITELECFDMCRSLNLLSPHYKYSFRDGCALCAHASKLVRSIWLRDYPEAISIILDLQDRIYSELGDRPESYPLRYRELFFPRDQLTLFTNFTLQPSDFVI